MSGYAFRCIIAFLVSGLFCLTSSSVLGQNLRPVSELPKNVKTKDGEIGIFADWKNAANSQVQCFIVNRSDKPVTLNHAYGNCYLKMEVQNEAKKWDRIQIHLDEMCGTGLGRFQLKPGHWVQQSHGTGFASAPNKAAPKAIPKNTGQVIADLEGAIAKLRDFMSRARLTKAGLDEYNAKIKGLEDELATAKAVQAKNEAMAAQVKDKKEAPKQVAKSENRQVRLRMYDFACRATSNSGTILFDNFEAIKKCKSDAHSIRYADIDRLRGIIFGKIKLEPIQNGPMPAGVPTELAVSALERSWHPVEEVTATLNEVIGGKDEKLKTIAKTVKEKISRR